MSSSDCPVHQAAITTNEEKPFPWLDLPNVMRYEVWSKLSVLDLYHLSYVSEEAKNWVKEFVRYRKFRMKLDATRRMNVILIDKKGKGFNIFYGNSSPRGATSSFNFGEAIVVTGNETVGSGFVEVTVLTEQLPADWDREESMKFLVAHLAEVFTRDVCIETRFDVEREKMELVRNLKLEVHCYKRHRNYSSQDAKKLLMYKRVAIKCPGMSARALKMFFNEWMLDGRSDYFEIGKLARFFKIHMVMRGHQPIENGMESNYFLTSPRGHEVNVSYIKANNRDEFSQGKIIFQKNKMGPGYRTCFRT